jgi:hypothetical protein
MPDPNASDFELECINRRVRLSVWLSMSACCLLVWWSPEVELMNTVEHAVPTLAAQGGIPMPALPWTSIQDVNRDGGYVAMASRLPLKHYRSIPGFLRDTLQIRKQLARTDGLVGYSLDAQLTRKTFWTLSVWTDEPSLRAFASTNPHRAIVERLRPLMNTTRFEFFTVSGDEVPLAWSAAKERLR